MPDLNVRFANLMQTIFEQTGKQVVVLIDEYDAPLLDVTHEDTQLDALRDIMRNFYSPLKGCEKMLRLSSSQVSLSSHNSASSVN